MQECIRMGSSHAVAGDGGSIHSCCATYLSAETSAAWIMIAVAAAAASAAGSRHCADAWPLLLPLAATPHLEGPGAASAWPEGPWVSRSASSSGSSLRRTHQQQQGAGWSRLVGVDCGCSSHGVFRHSDQGPQPVIAGTEQGQADIWTSIYAIAVVSEGRAGTMLLLLWSTVAGPSPPSTHLPSAAAWSADPRVLLLSRR
jgi:hypothetical protein